MREVVTLECTVCKRRCYTTKVDKKKTGKKLELKKYCPFDRKHTVFKQIK